MLDVGHVHEEWRPVPGWSQYEASSEGRVRHVRTKRVRTVFWHRTGYGFLVIGPRKNRQTWGVHQLVAAAFLGGCPPGKEVNHKDTIKRNNHPSNLEYETRQGNIAHAKLHGCFDWRAKGVGRWKDRYVSC